MAIDTGLGDGRFDPILSYRSTGLDQLSNPTTNLEHTAGKALTNMTGALRGMDDWDGKDFRNLRRLMPMQNLPGVEQMLNVSAPNCKSIPPCNGGLTFYTMPNAFKPDTMIPFSDFVSTFNSLSSIGA